MKYFFFYILYFNYILNFIISEKTVELNFYRNISYKGDSDYSPLIKNKLYTTIIIGSYEQKVFISM